MIRLGEHKQYRCSHWKTRFKYERFRDICTWDNHLLLIPNWRKGAKTGLITTEVLGILEGGNEDATIFMTFL